MVVIIYSYRNMVFKTSYNLYITIPNMHCFTLTLLYAQLLTQFNLFDG